MNEFVLRELNDDGRWRTFASFTTPGDAEWYQRERQAEYGPMIVDWRIIRIETLTITTEHVWARKGDGVDTELDDSDAPNAGSSV